MLRISRTADAQKNGNTSQHAYPYETMPCFKLLPICQLGKTMSNHEQATTIYRMARRLERVPSWKEAAKELDIDVRTIRPADKRMIQKIIRGCRRSYKETLAGIGPRDYTNIYRSRYRELRNMIKTGLSKSEIDLHWVKDKKHKPIKITMIDLIITLFAVEVSEGDNGGLSYKQLDNAFKQLRKKSCHNNKAARLIKIMLELKLIGKLKNYQAGKHGNVYQLQRDKEEYDLSWLENPWT